MYRAGPFSSTFVVDAAPSVVVLYPGADENVADRGVVLLETAGCPGIDHQVRLHRLMSQAVDGETEWGRDKDRGPT